VQDNEVVGSSLHDHRASRGPLSGTSCAPAPHDDARARFRRARYRRPQSDIAERAGVGVGHDLPALPTKEELSVAVSSSAPFNWIEAADAARQRRSGAGLGGFMDDVTAMQIATCAGARRLGDIRVRASRVGTTSSSRSRRAAGASAGRRQSALRRCRPGQPRAPDGGREVSGLMLESTVPGAGSGYLGTSRRPGPEAARPRPRRRSAARIRGPARDGKPPLNGPFAIQAGVLRALATGPVRLEGPGN